MALDAIIDDLRRGGETVDIQWEVVSPVLFAMCPHCCETRRQLVIATRPQFVEQYLFNAQPKAPAQLVAGPGHAGAFGWALNEQE